jgi:hypothetical protein
MEPRNLLILVVAGAGLWAAKELYVRFFARTAVCNALSAVGRRALERTPDRITLIRVDSPTWTHGPAVEQQAAPLRDAGFRDLGVFAVDKMPDVLIRMLHHPETYIAVHVYDHTRRGSWIEFASRYSDGSSHTLTTMPHTGLDRPAWVRTIHADKNTPADQLYHQFKTQRDRQNIKPVAAAEVIHEFEDGYMRHMIWRQNCGISPEEVARVMVKWASRRADKAASTSV